jgi:hypothetical protein
LESPKTKRKDELIRAPRRTGTSWLPEVLNAIQINDISYQTQKKHKLNLNDRLKSKQFVRYNGLMPIEQSVEEENNEIDIYAPEFKNSPEHKKKLFLDSNKLFNDFTN